MTSPQSQEPLSSCCSKTALFCEKDGQRNYFCTGCNLVCDPVYPAKQKKLSDNKPHVPRLQSVEQWLLQHPCSERELWVIANFLGSVYGWQDKRHLKMKKLWQEAQVESSYSKKIDENAPMRDQWIDDDELNDFLPKKL